MTPRNRRLEGRQPITRALAPMGALSTTERNVIAMLTNSDDIAAERREAILQLLAGPPKADELAPLPDRVLDLEQTAELLRQTKRTVHRLCNEGHLTRVKFPGRKQSAGILASSVTALIQRSATGNAA